MKPAVHVAIALTAGVLGAGTASDAARGASTAPEITYSTQRLGVTSGYPGFRRVVAATLRDPRGWSLDGRVRFREVARDGKLTIALANPAAVDGFGACSAFYSCRVGDLVLINADRWRSGTASYRGRALLRSYRRMVINHEVGHALGFGHAGCSRHGAPAPVMQQQSKALGGCRRNAWPLDRERARYAARAGVRPPGPTRSTGRPRRVAALRSDRADGSRTPSAARRRDERRWPPVPAAFVPAPTTGLARSATCAWWRFAPAVCAPAAAGSFAGR